MPDVFLSYAREDAQRARALAKALGVAGFDVWWDARLRWGYVFHEEIEQNLKASKCVVVLWSHASVNARWVRSEAELGAELGRLVPVRIEEVSLPFGFKDYHTPRLDLDAALPEEFVAAIRDLVTGTRTPSKPVRQTAPPSRNWLVFTVCAAVLIAVVAALWRESRDSEPPAIDTSTTTRVEKVDTVTTSATDTVTTTTAPRRVRPSQLDERYRAYRQHIKDLDRLETPFYGPIDPVALTQYREQINRTAESLRRRDCAEAEVQECVVATLREFPLPKALPPPGKIIMITDDPRATGRFIPLDEATFADVLTATDGYTAPLTILVRGKWSGNSTQLCTDEIAAAIEFEGLDQTFKLSAGPGRQTAASLIGKPLRPLRDGKVVTMEGWPARARLQARNVATRGQPSTRCLGDLPQVLVWQHDARFNSADPYELVYPRVSH